MNTKLTKLTKLKDELDVANSIVKLYISTVNDIKAEIKELEEADIPKPGDIYRHSTADQTYIVADVGYNKYCLINRDTGNRYSDPASTLSELFGNHRNKFQKLIR